MRGLFVDDFGIRGWVVWVGGGILLAVLVVVGVAASKQEKADCEEAGGKIVTTHSYGTTSDGKSITLTNTECVVGPR